ncbi:hypothetical protein KC845_02920 [Candidatus Kaiserbacteria bacterium]|nr:hypothetical protein [Candidatus Kaiserbacteria bacterium]
MRGERGMSNADRAVDERCFLVLEHPIQQLCLTKNVDIEGLFGRADYYRLQGYILLERYFRTLGLHYLAQRHDRKAQAERSKLQPHREYARRQEKLALKSQREAVSMAWLTLDSLIKHEKGVESVNEMFREALFLILLSKPPAWFSRHCRLKKKQFAELALSLGLSAEEVAWLREKIRFRDFMVV